LKVIYKGEEKIHKIDTNSVTIDQFFKLIGINSFDQAQIYDGDILLYKPWMCKGSSKMSEVISFCRRKAREKEMGVMTMMFFPSSGKLGFDNYKNEKVLNEKMIDRETLKKMYQRENDLRLSKEIQEKMDECILSNMNEYANLLESIQRRVLKEYGFNDEDDLDLFREGLGIYNDDEELKSIPYYSKFNRARDGDLNVGDDLFDVSLTSIDQPSNLTSLSSFYESQLNMKNLPNGSPLVVIAGSIT